MFYGILAGFAALVVVLDQFTKYLTVSRIPLGTTVPAVPGVFQLTYVQNTGMAFSMLEGKRWFFLIITLAALALMVLAVRKKWVTHPLGLWALAAIAGGAVGNLSDRVRLGYVVDMIEVTFMKFAVFNVADCFVVCGAIALAVQVFLEERAEGKKHDSAG